MDHHAILAHVLPDIIMYGGDTEPWAIEFGQNDRTSFNEGALSSLSCVLHILPFSQSSYIVDADIDIPVLTKVAMLSIGHTGRLIARFDFVPMDTMDMRGKYVYQITLTDGDASSRIGQGHLVVKPNVNRGVL